MLAFFLHVVHSSANTVGHHFIKIRLSTGKTDYEILVYLLWRHLQQLHNYPNVVTLYIALHVILSILSVFVEDSSDKACIF